MAYLDATDLNDLQGLSTINEKRFAELGLVDAVKASSKAVNFISPSAKNELKTMSSIQNYKIPILKDQDVTVTTTPGFAIPANLPESDAIYYVAVDVFGGMRHTPAAFASNQLDSEWTKKEVMKNLLYKMGSKTEEALTVVMETRKTQLWNYTTQYNQNGGTFTFNAGTDTLEVNLAAQKNTMFLPIESMFADNELGGAVRYVTNRGGLATQRIEALTYGAGNDKNIQSHGLPTADRLHQTGNISAGSDVFNGYAFRDGAIGIIDNHPFDFANGTEINGRKFSISDINLPFINGRANIYTNNDVTNATALVTAGVDSNLIMTTFSEMAIWYRFYIVYPYNSDLSTRANDIVKIKGLTT
jgi:hypothetical protein